MRVDDGRIRRLTATESAEFQPRWSPDGRTIAFLGTRRGLTDLETTMEDNHVWVMAADGSGRRELGAAVDNRQGSADVVARTGRRVYSTVQERGHRAALSPAAVGRRAADGRRRATAASGSFSVAAGGALAYAFTGRDDLAQLYFRAGADRPARRLTDLNADVLQGVEVAPVEAFTFVSNDFKCDVEAFLTRPVGLAGGREAPADRDDPRRAARRSRARPSLQVAVLRAAAAGPRCRSTIRGSTGYGQAFADAVFRDQNGDEAQDVLYGVDAALRRNPWIDRDRHRRRGRQLRRAAHGLAHHADAACSRPPSRWPPSSTTSATTT